MGNTNQPMQCEFAEYPGYTDEFTRACMGDRWIVREGLDVSKIDNPEIHIAYKRTRKLTSYLPSMSADKMSAADKMAWFLMRWIYFVQTGTINDVEARILFLKKYINTQELQEFMTHEDASVIATEHPNKALVYLHDTIPGALNIVVKYESFVYHIDEGYKGEPMIEIIAKCTGHRYLPVRSKKSNTIKRKQHIEVKQKPTKETDAFEL